MINMVIVLDFYYQFVLIVSSSVECKVGSRPGQTGSQVSIAQLANKRLHGGSVKCITSRQDL